MSFRKFLTHKDLRIAKVGKKSSTPPCADIMSSYMDCLAFGAHESQVPPFISREFHNCINDFYKSPKDPAQDMKTALSKYLMPPKR